MTPEDWQHIAEDIKAHYDDYDGFVILHGTEQPDGIYRLCAVVHARESR